MVVNQQEVPLEWFIGTYTVFTIDQSGWAYPEVCLRSVIISCPLPL